MFEAHGPMVFGLCSLLLRDRQEAEDALQQTFLSGYRSMLDGTDPKEPSAWLAAIARNECLSRLRRRVPESVRLRDADLGAREDVAEVVDRRTEMAALSEAIAGLPPAQRRAVILRDFYGLSYREVSAALGVTGPAVESLLFRSRKRLQERLQSFRAASGVAALPLAVRDTLARSVPGFSSGLSTSGLGAAGAGLSAKLVSTSAAAKIAALALAAGIGTMTIVHESDSSDRHRGKAHSRAAIAADAPPPSSPTRPEATTREQFDVDAAHAIPSARLDHPAPTVEAWGPPPPAPTWEAVPVPSRMALPATVTFSSRNHRGLPRPTADTLGQSRRGATDGDGESRGSAPPPIAADVVPTRQADGSGDAGARGWTRHRHTRRRRPVAVGGQLAAQRGQPAARREQPPAS
jgi:RNA polymerase sigma factor (sigma-70 family)